MPAFGATFTVLNSSDSGAGSLRQAIMDANNNPGADLISFRIPGTKPYTIAPLSPLPSLTDPVTIDGTTQTNFTSQPIIQLNGAGAGPNANGLLILGGNSVIRGLVINRSANGRATDSQKFPMTISSTGFPCAGSWGNVMSSA